MSGELIRKQAYKTGATTVVTDYVDGFVYINGTLSYFPMPEGRVLYNAGAYNQEFVITDQQGNARLSFQNNAGTAKAMQENSYYGFGMTMASAMGLPGTPNKQLYNGGSEWQNDYNNSPDYYQTYYRNYDAALGRFVAVDPMAEATESLSVYHYAENNPIMMNDPDGNNPLPGGFSTFHTLSEWRQMYNNYWRTGIGADIQENVDEYFSGQTDIENACGCRMSSLGIGGAANADRRWETTSQSAVDNSNYVSLINNARATYGENARIGMNNGEYTISHRRYYAAYTGDFNGWQGYDVVTEIASGDKLNGLPVGDYFQTNRGLAPSNFNFQPSFGRNWQAAGIKNVSVYLYDEKEAVIFNLEIGMPTKSKYLHRTISQQEAQLASSKSYLQAMHMVNQEYLFGTISSISIPSHVASWMEFFLNQNLGGWHLATVTNILGTNPGAPVKFADYTLLK